MADGAPTRELGASGLNYGQSGYIEEELHPNLMGRQAIKVYKEMSDNDPLVSAIMYCIDMLVRQVEWNVQQEDASEEDGEFLESCMDDMSHSWSDFISEVMSMLIYGFSYHEIVYKLRQGAQPETGRTPTSKYDDQRIGWRKIPIRSQDSLDHWLFDDGGGIRAFVQKPPPKYEDVIIPINKGLLFRTSTYKNNPEGKSLLRGAYRPWYYKKRIEEIEGVGLERDLAGFPVIDIPAPYLSDQASTSEKSIVAAFKEIGKNIRRDKQEFLIMPNQYDENNNKMFDFRLMTSGGQRAFNTGDIIQRYDQRIAMTVLADFILLGHEKVGSFALSNDKTDVFAIALGTILDAIQDVLNRFAVPRLWEVNGLDTTAMPRIAHGDIEDQDLTMLGAFLTAMAQVGMQLFPDPDLEKHLRNLAHLPEVSEEVQAERDAEAEAQREQEELSRQQGQLGAAAGGAAARAMAEGATPEQASEAAQRVQGNGENPFADLVG